MFFRYFFYVLPVCFYSSVFSTTLIPSSSYFIVPSSSDAVEVQSVSINDQGNSIVSWIETSLSTGYCKINYSTSNSSLTSTVASGPSQYPLKIKSLINNNNKGFCITSSAAGFLAYAFFDSTTGTMTTPVTLPYSAYQTPAFTINDNNQGLLACLDDDESLQLHMINLEAESISAAIQIDTDSGFPALEMTNSGFGILAYAKADTTPYTTSYCTINGNVVSSPKPISGISLNTIAGSSITLNDLHQAVICFSENTSAQLSFFNGIDCIASTSLDTFTYPGISTHIDNSDYCLFAFVNDSQKLQYISIDTKTGDLGTLNTLPSSFTYQGIDIDISQPYFPQLVGNHRSDIALFFLSSNGIFGVPYNTTTKTFENIEIVGSGVMDAVVADISKSGQGISAFSSSTISSPTFFLLEASHFSIQGNPQKHYNLRKRTAGTNPINSK